MATAWPRCAVRGRASLAVVLLAGIVVVALAAVAFVLVRSSERTALRMSDEDAAGRAPADGGRSAAQDRGVAPREDASPAGGRERDPQPPTASRAPVPEDRLRPHDPREERLREQTGRAVFFGLVLDAQGAPVAGAKLFSGGEIVGTSDAAGAWRVEVAHDVLDRAGTAIAALAEAVGSCVSELIGPGRRIDLVLAPGRVVAGQAVRARDGSPVVGAVVDLLARGETGGTSAIDFALTTESDERGAFGFAGVPRAPIELRASATDCDTLDFRCERALDDALEVRLVLRELATVRGRFLPWPPRGFVGGAAPEVRAWVEGRGARWFDGRRLATPVAPDGTFDLQLPEQAIYRIALAAGDECAWVEELTVAAGERAIDLGRIELGPLATVVGSIALPAPGVAPFELEVAGSASCGDVELEFARPLEAAGRLRVGPFAMQACAVELWCGGRRLAGPIEVAARGAGAIDLGVVAVARAWLVRVVDEAGRPFAHCEVGLAADGSRLGGGTCDAQGRLVVVESDGSPLPDAGRVAASVLARGRTWWRDELDVTATTATGLVRLADVVLAEPAGGVVAGRFIAGDGRALAAVRASLVDDARRLLAHDISDSEGGFEFRGLGPGAWTLVVALDDGTVVELGRVDSDGSSRDWLVPAETSPRSR